MPDDKKDTKIKSKRTYIVHPKHGVININDPEIFEIFPPETMITPVPKPNRKGGTVKVKKLLPGGLLTASMRALVRAGQRTKQATVSDRMLINKSQIELAKDIMKNNPKKFRSSEDKLGPDVVDTIARRMAKNEKVQDYKEVLYKAAIDPKLEGRMDDFIDTAKKLEAYEKKNMDVVKAVIEKDVKKPKMNKSGGFIDMTKDKKYWKGIL